MNFIERIMGLSGTFLTLAATALVIIVGRLILNRMVKDKRVLPYHRQFFTMVLFLLGLFIAVALLPLPTEIRLEILSVLGIFLSAVIALSATSLVGNAMAGIMLRLMKSYRAGDFIEFDDFLGRVTDIGMLHTEIQLVTRDIMTLPNSLLIKKVVKVTRRSGTFVNAGVSIGYAQSHGSVESALKEAAETCGLAEPFVFVDELLDHAVRYRVYGLLEESSQLLSKSSELRCSILDTLHGHGIEIMSPSIVNRREYGPDFLFAPREKAPAKESPKPEDIEGLAFDRAEEAESIEQLYALEEKLNHEMAEMAGKGDEEEAGLDKEDTKKRKSFIKERLERIKTEIEKREKEKKKKRLDESASE